MKEKTTFKMKFTLSNVLITGMVTFTILLLFNLTNQVMLTTFMLIFLTVLGYKSVYSQYKNEAECALNALVCLSLIVLSLIFSRLTIIGVALFSIGIFLMMMSDFEMGEDDVLSLMIVLILVVLLKTLGAQTLIFIPMIYGLKVIYS